MNLHAAEYVAVAVSDVREAGYVTGITLRVDGGLILPGLMEGQDAIPWVRPAWREQKLNEAMEIQDRIEQNRKAQKEG